MVSNTVKAQETKKENKEVLKKGRPIGSKNKVKTVTMEKDTHIDIIMEESMNNQLDDSVLINDLQTECRVPTKDNPFMNPPLNEFSND